MNVSNQEHNWKHKKTTDARNTRKQLVLTAFARRLSALRARSCAKCDSHSTGCGALLRHICRSQGGCDGTPVRFGSSFGCTARSSDFRSHIDHARSEGGRLGGLPAFLHDCSDATLSPRVQDVSGKRQVLARQVSRKSGANSSPIAALATEAQASRSDGTPCSPG